MNICCRQPHFAFHQLLVLRPGSTNLRESFAALVAGKLSMGLWIGETVKLMNRQDKYTANGKLGCTLLHTFIDEPGICLQTEASEHGALSFSLTVNSQHMSALTHFFCGWFSGERSGQRLQAVPPGLSYAEEAPLSFVGTRRMRHILRVSLLPRQTCGFASCLQAKVRKPKMLRKWCWCSAFQRASAGSFVQLEKPRSQSFQAFPNYVCSKANIGSFGIEHLHTFARFTV